MRTDQDLDHRPGLGPVSGFDEEPMDWLVEECLQAVRIRGANALEELCRAHPEYADGLRAALRRAHGESTAPEPLGDSDAADEVEARRDPSAAEGIHAAPARTPPPAPERFERGRVGPLRWIGDGPLIAAAVLFAAIFGATWLLQAPAEQPASAADHRHRAPANEPDAARAPATVEAGAQRAEPRAAGAAEASEALWAPEAPEVAPSAGPANSDTSMERIGAAATPGDPDRGAADASGPDAPARLDLSDPERAHNAQRPSGAARATPGPAAETAEPADELDATRAALEFLAALVASPEGGGELRVSQVLERGDAALERADFEPDLRAELAAFLGRGHAALGDSAAAEGLLARARDAARAAYGRADPRVLALALERAQLLIANQRWDAAAKLLTATLEERSAAFGPADAALVLAAREVAAHLRDSGADELAAALFARALEAARVALAPHALETLQIVDDLAALKERLGKPLESEALYVEALERIRALWGERHERFVDTAGRLAELYESLGRTAEAEELYRAALQRSLEVFGEDRPATFACREDLAGLLDAAGRHEEAAELYQALLVAWKGLIGDDGGAALVTAYKLGRSYLRQGRCDEAVQLLASSFQDLQYALGDDDPRTIAALVALVDAYECADELQSAALFASLLVARTEAEDAAHAARVERLEALRAAAGDTGRE